MEFTAGKHPGGPGGRPRTRPRSAHRACGKRRPLAASRSRRRRGRPAPRRPAPGSASHRGATRLFPGRDWP
ncbi:hypothetical protein GCN74_09740 [Janthinobacterium sp. FT14W]|nr:hypothetical protein GCN74_09740 [Janthinobacterium sp. FT14W]